MRLGRDAVLRSSKKKDDTFNAGGVAVAEKVIDYSENCDSTFKVFAMNNLRNSDKRVAVAMEIREGKKLGVIEAELVFAEGDSIVVVWNNIAEREKHLHMINGYTLIYDRREKRQFEDWKKRQA